MSDEWVKERDQAAVERGKDEAQFCRCAGPTCSGCETKTERVAAADFVAGADFGRAYEQKRAAKLVEALEHYESSHYHAPTGLSCSADKTASDALAEYEGKK